MSERVIVLAVHGAREELAYLQARYPVSSVFRRRLAVVDLDDSELAVVRARPGVLALMASPADPIPASLDNTERLFVRGWQMCHAMAHKQRPGDGQGWDAPGFDPPDPP